MSSSSNSGVAYKKPPGKKLHWYSKLLITIVAIVLCFLVLEGLSTLLTGWIKFPPIFLTEYKLEGNIIRDFDIGFVNKPNSTVNIDEKSGRCRYHINLAGLRNDYEAANHKAANECRILCVGDSTVFGLHVDQTQTLPAQLEVILNNRNNGTHYSLLNAGCPGYTSFQVMRYIEMRGAYLKPDVITISVGVNDAKFRDSEKSRDYRNVPLPFVQRILFPTNTYLILSYVKSLFAPLEEVKARTTPAVNLKEFNDNLSHAIKLAKEMGATVIFCPISVPADYLAVTCAVCDRESLQVVDAENALARAYVLLEHGADEYSGIKADPRYYKTQLMGALAGDNRSDIFLKVHGDNRVMVDSIHPNPIGYRAIAEDLAAVIP